MEIVIFSKDRPFQLEGLLESLFQNCQDIAEYFGCLTVLYKKSPPQEESVETKEAPGKKTPVDYDYSAVGKRYPMVQMLEETDFKANLISVLKGSTSVLFLVDDTIFVAPFCLKDIEAILASEKSLSGVSLRLGKNTNYSYAMNSSQEVPTFSTLKGDLLSYPWLPAKGDFGYPFEVSSSVYLTAELAPVLFEGTYSNPNTLEAELTTLRERTATTLLGLYPTSRAFSTPLNSVQTNSWQNRASTAETNSAEYLNSLYKHGIRLNVKKLQGMIPIGVHQEIDPSEHLTKTFGVWKDGQDEFHSQYYEIITQTRAERLAELLPAVLEGLTRNVPAIKNPHKKIFSCLEMGAGYDVFTSQLLKTRRLKVDIHDGREAILKAVKDKYFYANTYVGNLNHPFSTGKRYNLILAYGILYHLSDISNFIASCGASCADNGVVLLDFVTNGRSDDSVGPVTEPGWLTQALDGTGTRPSKLHVMKQFAKYFEYIYSFAPPAHEEYQSGARAQFAASRIPLEGPFTRETF